MKTMHPKMETMGDGCRKVKSMSPRAEMEGMRVRKMMTVRSKMEARRRKGWQRGTGIKTR